MTIVGSLPRVLAFGIFVFSPFKNHPVRCGRSGPLASGPDPESYRVEGFSVLSVAVRDPPRGPAAPGPAGRL